MVPECSRVNGSAVSNVAQLSLTSTSVLKCLDNCFNALRCNSTEVAEDLLLDKVSHILATQDQEAQKSFSGCMRQV